MKKYLLVLLAALAVLCAAASCKNRNNKDSASQSESSSTQSQTSSVFSDSGGGAMPDIPQIGEAYVAEMEGHNSRDFYQITLESHGGMKIKGAAVTLCALGTSNPLSGEAISSANGNVYIFAPKGYYSINVEGVPAGYSLRPSAEGGYYTDEEFTPVTLVFDTAVISDEIPSGKRYAKGDVMYDFSITSRDIEVDENGAPLKNSDGSYKYRENNYTLSSLLAGGRNTVVLNFWATWCVPCRSEMPHMDSVYNMKDLSGVPYRDKAVLLAIDADATESSAQVRAFQNSNGYTFDFADDNAGLVGHFYVTAYPITVVIDRYGVIVEYIEGSLPQAGWLEIFAKYTADDYTQNVSSEGGEQEGPSQILPTYSMPASEEIAEALGTGSGFKYSAAEDEYAWPWLISDDGSFVYTSNAKMSSTYAALIVDFETKKGDVLAFDFRMESEVDEAGNLIDVFYVVIDNALQEISARKAGMHSEWRTYYAFLDKTGGSHTMLLVYEKDYSDDEGEDCVQIRNLRTVSADQIYSPTYFKNFAATQKSAQISDPHYTGPRYENYVDVKLAPDGFYHVFDAQKYADNQGFGPLLLAELRMTTPWDERQSVYNYAQLGYFVEPEFGIDLGSEISDYARLSTLTKSEAMPVNEEIKRLLDGAVKAMVDNGYVSREYDPREWLEMCLYYESYGTTGEFVENDLTGFDFRFADQTLHIGENDMKMLPFMMTPRGYKYVFVPEESGYYRFYSTGDTNASAWLFTEESLSENYRYVAENGEDFDGNFSITYYLNGGEKYYFAVDYTSLDDRYRVMAEGSKVIVEKQQGSGTYSGSASGASAANCPAAERALLPQKSKTL